MLLRGAAQGTAGMAGQSVGSGRTLLTWREGNRSSGFRDVFREHFWITTSGNFSTPALH